MVYKELTVKERKIVADFISLEDWRLPDAKHKELWHPTMYMDRLDVYWRPKGEWHQRERLMQKTAEMILQQTAADYFAHADIVFTYFEAVSARDIDTDMLESICFYLLSERK